VTTLQLARAIAEAVLAAGVSRHGDPTQAVLDTLDQHGCWFCTVGPRWRLDALRVMDRPTQGVLFEGHHD